MGVTTRTFIVASLATVLALAGPTASLPLALDEGPDDWVCDESGQLVCAGNDLGSNVQCDDSPTALASCTFTWGGIFGGGSPLLLPGAASATFDAAIEVCVDGEGCTTTTVPSQSDACIFPAGTICVISLTGADTVEDVALDMGQCLTVLVHLEGVADAWTPSEAMPLAHATFEREHTGAGQVCNFDNGRP